MSYWLHCRIVSIYLFFSNWRFFFKCPCDDGNEQLSVLRTQNEVKSPSWNLEKIAIYPLNRVVRKSRSSGILGKISARIHKGIICSNIQSGPFPFLFFWNVNLSVSVSIIKCNTKFCSFNFLLIFLICFSSSTKESKESKTTSKDDKGNYYK